jgi:hypothetical protein
MKLLAAPFIQTALVPNPAYLITSTAPRYQ